MKPPKQPTGLKLELKGTPVSGALTWNKIGGAIGGYNVYRSTDGSKGAKVGTSANNVYVDTTLVVGVKYWWCVAAYNAGGEGPFSTQVVADVIALPLPPAGVTLTLLEG